MIVSLCSRKFDILGAELLRITGDSELDSIERRVSRTATLDGGAVLLDSGYAEADRTLTLQAQVSTDAHDNLQRLVSQHPEFTLSFRGGCYLGAVQRYQLQPNNIARLTFLVTRKLSG